MNLTTAIIWTFVAYVACVSLWGIITVAIYFGTKKNLRRNVKHGGGGSRE